MAFATTLLAVIYFIFLVAIFLIALILFIIGACIRKKRRKASNVLFTICGIISALLGFLLIRVLWPETTTLDTRNGKMKIDEYSIIQYEAYLYAGNKDGIHKFVEKHPEIIYYYDNNGVTLLDYAMYNLDLELMQLAINNGAIFDDPLTYDHSTFNNSFDSFFDCLDYPDWQKEMLHQPGKTTDEIIETVEFMLNHGASLEYENADEYKYQNFYEEAVHWVMEDDELSEKDQELLTLLTNNME